MLDVWKPDVVVAFVDNCGSGTTDMIAKANMAGVRVLIVEARIIPIKRS